MARPHIEPYCELDFDFLKLPLAGFNKGIRYKMLSMDPDTGASTMKWRFEPGYRRPPGFAWSEMEMLVLSGSLKVGEQVCREGQYFCVPPGVALPALASDDGCEVLIFWNDGEPSFEESTEDHPYAERFRLINVHSYAGLPWIVPNVHPGPAPGCLIKLLKYNERTHAMTFLYCMTPAYWQDNISYHDCAEEAYHIWGTSWMMQFGDLPTGGYFWRPPYINHGAFSSHHGTLAIGRVDSEIFNHFHFNPWTNADENRDRAIARFARQKPTAYRWVASHGHNHPHGPADFEYPDSGEEAAR